MFLWGVNDIFYFNDSFFFLYIKWYIKDGFLHWLHLILDDIIILSMKQL